MYLHTRTRAQPRTLTRMSYPGPGLDEVDELKTEMSVYIYPSICLSVCRFAGVFVGGFLCVIMVFRHICLDDH